MPDRTCAHCGGPAAKKYCSLDCYHLASRKSERLTVTCPCGRSFETTAKMVAGGRGKFCSRACKEANATRPSGLKYDIKVKNRAWLKPGERFSPETEFKPGHETWNRGLAGTHFSPATEFQPGSTAGEANWRWNGGPGKRHADRPGYEALHYRVHRERGPASGYSCAHADTTCKGVMQWANISQEYKDVDDFMPLCQSHHVRYDGTPSAWGVAQEHTQSGVRP